jgi:hypothetical protein
MSIPVDVAALRAEIERFGARALLVTTSPDGHPHVTSAAVGLEGGELTMGAGRTTRANVAAHDVVTVVWPTGPDASYCLIVDGSARVREPETLVVRPSSAVLHRLVGAPAELPSCVRLEEPAPSA